MAKVWDFQRTMLSFKLPQAWLCMRALEVLRHLYEAFIIFTWQPWLSVNI
jgi:hypothetical protein